MKRLLCLLLICVLCLSFASCSDKKNAGADNGSAADAADDAVKTAIGKLTQKWTELYKKGETEDQYLEIKNTRIITIKENENEDFKNIDKIVEFMLLTNRRNYQPAVYTDPDVCNNVIFYRDGRIEAYEGDYINKVRSRNYADDFSDVIGSIDDRGDSYNAVYHLEKGDVANPCRQSTRKFEEVDKAIEALKTEWTNQYRDTAHDGKRVIEDGYLEIKNVRVITIKENDNEYFQDIDKIVDFVLMTNYYDLKPNLYTRAPAYYNVVFYRDGHTEVPASGYIDMVCGRAYITDFTDSVRSVDDLGSTYNAVYHL